MFQIFIFIMALNWFLRDVDPKIIKGLVKYGAIAFIILLVISSGNVICYVALAIATGLVGLNYFQRRSTY